jgi:hypothetical protein
MCHYILANRQIFNDKKVLEVGSGTGMSGIVAGHFAKSMVLTDHNEIVLNLLKENAEINEAAAGMLATLKYVRLSRIMLTKILATTKAHTTCQLLDWGNDSHLEKLGQHQYDIVIGSDVMFVKLRFVNSSPIHCSSFICLYTATGTIVWYRSSSQWTTYFQGTLVRNSSWHISRGRSMPRTTSSPKQQTHSISHTSRFRSRAMLQARI